MSKLPAHLLVANLPEADWQVVSIKSYHYNEILCVRCAACGVNRWVRQQIVGRSPTRCGSGQHRLLLNVPRSRRGRPRR